MKQVCLLTIFLILMNTMILCSSLSTAVAKLDLNNLSGFKCYGVTKLDSPIRVNAAGQIECFSIDGKECAGSLNNDIKCREFVTRNKASLKPIVCSKKDLKTKGHFCHKAKNFFFKRWHCPDETGLNMAVKFSKKFGVKCLSKDGRNCLTGHKAMKQCHWANICGKKKLNIYFTPKKCKSKDFKAGDWCAKGFAYFRHTGDFLCHSVTGLEMAVKLSKKGKVQCLSKDGKECLRDIKSDYQCLNEIHTLSEGNLIPPKTYSCSKGDFVPNTWCHTSYEKIFKPLKPKKLQAFRVNHNTVEKLIKKKEKKNPVKPTFIKILHNIINSNIVKTKEGIKAIFKIMEGFGMKPSKKDVKFITKVIKNGDVKKPEILKKIIEKIKISKPVREEVRLNSSPKECYKKNMEKLKDILQQPKTPAKIEKFIKLLDKKFYISKDVKKEIKNIISMIDQKKPRSIDKAFRQIKDYVGVRHVKNKQPIKIKLQAKCGTQFFKGLRKLFKKSNFKNPAGLRKIHKHFKKHFKIIPSLWRKIKNLIKRFEINTKKDIKILIRKIKKLIPKKNLAKKHWIKGRHF
jgi:hypothetical protein